MANEKELTIRREYGYPNLETFKIDPIKKLLEKYVGTGKGWIDPFAGNNSPAEITNDLNPNNKATFHLQAEEFGKQLTGMYEGILFDPPYSPRQISECYKGIGLKVTMKDTQNGLLYSSVKKTVYNKIIIGGTAISFGWQSGGFGEKLGFKMIEILLVYHGGGHNDTIVVVEKKVQSKLIED